MFYSNQFLPADHRPAVHVVFLPMLESPHPHALHTPLLDIIAWLPYGVVCYTFPLVLAALLWLFRPPALRILAKAFGHQNCIGIFIFTQIILPYAAPWYEIIYVPTPTVYDMPGSAGGLARIDESFGGEGYRRTFSSSPLVFGIMGTLFISALWPDGAKWAWGCAGVLYWSMMYLSHHYLLEEGVCKTI
ncbi:hypothetical protein DFJ58DRAFT_717252 [Suillus subalutaceus]|uniref:uncharacterized protein n=1 Tax=Suillus subalutaceus TaxID=48586 RepID=UPI001B85F9DE|nr:uncharacterized protein DFJ58DRAFT_717252 [Suillus subalutaceus]KAG1847030.1 hypothetical protein DFJ58DRAFT_717252 [Suillus subalutaceus]